MAYFLNRLKESATSSIQNLAKNIIQQEQENDDDDANQDTEQLDSVHEDNNSS